MILNVKLYEEICDAVNYGYLKVPISNIGIRKNVLIIGTKNLKAFSNFFDKFNLECKSTQYSILTQIDNIENLYVTLPEQKEKIFPWNGRYTLSILDYMKKKCNSFDGLVFFYNNAPSDSVNMNLLEIGASIAEFSNNYLGNRAVWVYHTRDNILFEYNNIYHIFSAMGAYECINEFLYQNNR